MLTPRVIIPLCIALISLFLAQQFVLPLWKEAQELNAQRSEAERMLADLRTRYEERKRVVDAWRALEENKKERVLLAVPNDEDTPNLLVFLDRAMQENGLSSGQIVIGSSEAPSSESANVPLPSLSSLPEASPEGGVGKLMHIPITLTAQGEYESIKSFLLRAERHLRILNPDTFSLRVQDNEDGGTTLDAQMMLQAYHLSSEENP